MTVLTTRPSATVTAGDWQLEGGGSVNTNLDDSPVNDSTGIFAQANVYGVDPAWITVANHSVPSGGMPKTLKLRLRQNIGLAGYAALSSARLIVNPFDVDKTNGFYVTNATKQTVTVLTEEIQSNPTAGDDPTAVAVILTHVGSSGGVAHIISELYVDLVYVAKPTLTVDSPTGTINENQPTVEWTPTLDVDGLAQAWYQVKVFDDATYGGGGFNPSSSTADWNSGEVQADDDSVQVGTPLVDDIYKAYVRVAQSVNGQQHWSDWTAGSAFTVDAANPATPTISATGDDDGGGIALVLEEVSGDDETAYFEVSHSIDGGTTWEFIRTLLGDGLIANPTPGTPTPVGWADYETPNGVTVTYRARAISDTGNVSDYSTDTAVWESGDWWIKHPWDPNLSITPLLMSRATETRDFGTTVHKVLGREDPIVTSDSSPMLPAGELVLLDLDGEFRDGIDALIDSAEPLLLQGPAIDDEPDRWIRFTGEHVRSRIIDKSWAHERTEAFTWQEVARPEGVFTP